MSKLIDQLRIIEVMPYSIKYQASVQYNKYHYCRGTLIHPQWVVSAVGLTCSDVTCINQWLRATSSTSFCNALTRRSSRKDRRTNEQRGACSYCLLLIEH
uniref:Peptidase S1 domain-containing protein n=1 Tax=Oncorhynchus tshawytscha TaxID=74940 RepID=A0AAZ3QDT1_ONCTS